MDNYLPRNQTGVFTRELAYQILLKNIKNPKIIEHSLDVEAVMKAIYEYIYKSAIKQEGDLKKWQAVGLIHDADYEIAKGKPQRQGRTLQQKEPIKIPEDISYAISSRNFEQNLIPPRSLLDWGLICCDDLTLIIRAITKMTPQTKLTSLTIEYVIDKYQNSSPAHQKQKKLVSYCETKLHIPLNEFIKLTLLAMQQANSESIVANLNQSSYTTKSE